MKNNHTNQLFGLLLATLFISTSGVLGKYIAMPTEVIVWFRSFIGMLFLVFYCKLNNISIKITNTKDIVTLVISSLFLGAHWITYFYALKLSSVAIGVLSLYTFPVITALLEPWFLNTKFDSIHLLFGLMVLLGIYFLVPELNLQSKYTKGILFGVFSALLYAVRNLILKKNHTQKYHGSMLMFYQTLLISIVLLPVLFYLDVSNIQTQYPYVLLLGIVTTALGHSLMIRSFRYFSVSTATIISSVQPIFGIILAFLFLYEIPEMSTYIGGALILSTVLFESIRSKKS
ncbi:MAG: DMT family transporter [Flavobacteriaceae bacterium]|nr:DMT family transporter [Flavobacteriaceae bacterium]